MCVCVYVCTDISIDICMYIHICIDDDLQVVCPQAGAALPGHQLPDRGAGIYMTGVLVYIGAALPGHSLPERRLQPLHRRRLLDGELPGRQRAQPQPPRVSLRGLVPRRGQCQVRRRHSRLLMTVTTITDVYYYN